MKKKFITVSVLLLILIFIVAANTTPSDKKIKVNVIEALWGDKVPNKYSKPEYYEQFMDITTEDVIIDDWIFLKRIRYKFGNDKKIIGYAAFGKVMIKK